MEWYQEKFAGSQDHETRQHVSTSRKSCFKKCARRFPGLDLKTGGCDWWCMWNHRESCVKVKQRCGGPEGVRVMEKEMGKFAPSGTCQFIVGEV